MTTLRSRRARLALQSLEDRTVPSGGNVTVGVVKNNVVLTGDDFGAHVTLTEIGPLQFKITGDATTTINGADGTVGVTATLAKNAALIGLFGALDTNVTINGTGQALVNRIELHMSRLGDDNVTITGIQVNDLFVAPGSPQPASAEHDTVSIDSVYVKRMFVQGGTDGLNMTATRFVAGDPAHPSSKVGVFVDVPGGGGNPDSITLSSMAVFGSVYINDENNVHVVVDGSGGNPAYQGLVKNDLLINLTSPLGNGVSEIEVANLSVGQNTIVNWEPNPNALLAPFNPLTVSLTNVDSGGSLIVGSIPAKPPKPGVLPPTTLTVNGCSVQTFIYSGNNQDSIVSVAGSKFSTLSYLGGTAKDSLVVDSTTVDKLASIKLGDGSNTISLNQSHFPKAINLSGGTGTDSVTVELCTADGLLYDGGAGTNTFSLGDSNISGPVSVKGGAGNDTFAVSNSSAELTRLYGGDGTNSFTLSGCQVDTLLDIKGGIGNDTVMLNGCSEGSLKYDGGGGTNTFTLTGARESKIGGDVSLKGGSGGDAVTVDWCNVTGNFNYNGGDGDNSFTIKGGSSIAKNTNLLGGSGPDRIVVNQTTFGTLSKGKYVGGNVTIAPGGIDNNNVLFSYNAFPLPAPVRIRGNLTISAIKSTVIFGQTEVSGTTQIQFRGAFGNATASELSVDSSTFYGAFIVRNAGGFDFLDFGRYSVGLTTTFYRGLNLNGVSGNADVEFCTNPNDGLNGDVNVYGAFLYKVPVHVGPRFHKH